MRGLQGLINHCFNRLKPRKWGEGLGKKYDIYDLTHDNTKSIFAANKGENLGEIIEEFCESKGMGIDVLYHDGLERYAIYIYKFHSKEDSIVFSSDLDNLADCTYTEDISDFANVARITQNESVYTVPDGEDGNYSKYSDINRFETTFTSDLDDNDKDKIDDFVGAVRSQGIRKLSKHSITKAITAEIVNTGTYIYGTDYLVGDTVKIITDFGVTTIAQLIEMTESWDGEGYRLIPTFANYKMIDEDGETDD